VHQARRTHVESHTEVCGSFTCNLDTHKQDEDNGHNIIIEIKRSLDTMPIRSAVTRHESGDSRHLRTGRDRILGNPTVDELMDELERRRQNPASAAVVAHD